ncbi:hypothetical protein OKW29_006069 [Paraburkholderia sp. CI3]
MTSDGGIDRAEDRLRQIREDDRQREREHPAMPAHRQRGRAGWVCGGFGSRGGGHTGVGRTGIGRTGIGRPRVVQERSCTHTQGETTTAQSSGSRAAKSAAVSD